MILNIVLLVVGALFLIYGIRKKLKFWIVAGLLILALGAGSAYMDYRTAGISAASPNGRTPFVIDHFMN